MSTRFTEFHAPFQGRPSPNNAYSTYFRKIYKFPYFREIYVFCLIDVFAPLYFEHDAFMHHALQVLDAPGPF